MQEPLFAAKELMYILHKQSYKPKQASTIVNITNLAINNVLLSVKKEKKKKGTVEISHYINLNIPIIRRYNI